MALSIKKLGTRAITALVFVIILITGILFHYLTFSLLFLVVSIWGLVEFYAVCEAIGAKPQKKLGYLIGFLCYLAFVKFDLLLSMPIYFQDSIKWLLLLAPLIIFSGVVFNRQGNSFTNSLLTVAGIVYVILPFALLHELVITTNAPDASYNFTPAMLFGIILLIWCNDTFAYLGGSVFGKHKLIERISPAKTWEGTIIGVVITFAGSFVIAAYSENSHPIFWMCAGIAVPLLSTIGDLVQSAMKREAGIKDTGSIMPGHGGILDRFDSLIFVSPFIVAIFKIFT